MIIAVDFDGVLCRNKFPDIGTANDLLIEKLKDNKARGDKLILWSCREYENLNRAVAWCAERGLFFDAVNENIVGISRKIYADIYIDDKSVKPMWEEKPKAPVKKSVVKAI